MLEIVSVIFFAFILDLLIGDPRYRYHPVRIMGHGISFFSKVLRRGGLGGRRGGIFLVLILETIILGAYLVISLTLRKLYPLSGWGFDLFVCYSCLALKDLISQTKLVIRALEKGDLSKARECVARVVGRDVRYLDEEGVCRATMETLAENFVDGFLSPVFWYLAGGIAALLLGFSPVVPALCAMLGFKVASTLDSMVGYKNKEYAEFGWAGARLDDIMNFIPARMSLVILFFGAWVSGLNPMDGFKIALRDRLKHESPNAAHAESFTAGVFHTRLGGPTRYPHGLKDKPWLGDGDISPGPAHIRKMTTLVKRSAWVTVAVSVGTLVLTLFLGA